MRRRTRANAVLLLLLVATGLGAGTGPAGAEPEVGAPTVGIVGDSLAFQADEQIFAFVNRQHRITFADLNLAQRVRDVLEETKEAVHGPHPPDIFIVVLGTSQSDGDPPALWRDEMTALLDAVAPRVDCIRVFDIDETLTGIYRHHDRYAPTYNRITRNLVTRYRKADWVHFGAWAELADRDFERPDILHHDLPGKVQIARLVRMAVDGCDPALTHGPFWDVRDDAPDATAIRWLGRHHIANGFANHTFRARIANFVPLATRGEFLTELWRLAGRPVGFGPHPWTDTLPSQERPLRWAAANQIAGGYPGGRFRPEHAVSRGQAVTMAWAWAGRPEGLAPHPWTDGRPTLDRALDWAAAAGLLTGFPDGTVRPDAPLRVGHSATLLFHARELGP